jgi:hypothetical protein
MPSAVVNVSDCGEPSAVDALYINSTSNNQHFRCRCLPVHGKQFELLPTTQQQLLPQQRLEAALAAQPGSSPKQQHLQDVLRPAPGTAVLQGCCLSPGFFDGSFQSPAAAAAAAERSAHNSCRSSSHDSGRNSRNSSHRQLFSDTSNPRSRTVNSKQQQQQQQVAAVNSSSLPEPAAAAHVAAETAGAADIDCCQQQWQPDWWSWHQQQQQQQAVQVASNDIAHAFNSLPAHNSLQQGLGFFDDAHINQLIAQAGSNHLQQSSADLMPEASNSSSRMTNLGHSSQLLGADTLGAIASLLSQWYTAGSHGAALLQGQQLHQQQQQQLQQQWQQEMHGSTHS